MQAGPEQFADWMRRRGFNRADASRYLEMDAPYVSVIADGKRSPGLRIALKLERLTGIPVEAWAESDLDESETELSSVARKSKK